MKIIITEEQFNRFNRSSPALQNGIIKFLNQYIENGQRTIGKKSRNYGNLRENWCVDGKDVITAIYYFNDGNFDTGRLLVSENLISTIQKIFSVKKSFALHVFEEWYDDTIVPKFEKIVGDTGLYITNIDTLDREHPCIPEPVKPEGITDEEMIDFIVKNTLYTKPDVIKKIESGERDLEDFYLDIAGIVKQREIKGF